MTGLAMIKLKLRWLDKRFGTGTKFVDKLRLLNYFDRLFEIL